MIRHTRDGFINNILTGRADKKRKNWVKMHRLPVMLTKLSTRTHTHRLILLKQETVSGSGISWASCKSAPCSRQTTTATPHHSVFYRPDALPAAQPTASKHWRHNETEQATEDAARHSGNTLPCSELCLNLPWEVTCSRSGFSFLPWATSCQ